jgi:hypothetical protein
MKCREPQCPNTVSVAGRAERHCAVHAERSMSATPADIEAVYKANLAAIKARRQFTIDEEKLTPQSALVQPQQGRAGRISPSMSHPLGTSSAASVRWR